MRSPHPATAQLPAGTPPALQHTSMLATGFEDSLLHDGPGQIR
jgi:hypothetical protein